MQIRKKGLTGLKNPSILIKLLIFSQCMVIWLGFGILTIIQMRLDLKIQTKGVYLEFNGRLQKLEIDGSMH